MLQIVRRVICQSLRFIILQVLFSNPLFGGQYFDGSERPGSDKCDDSFPKLISGSEYRSQITSVRFNGDSSKVVSIGLGFNSPIYLWSNFGDKPATSKLLERCDSAKEIEFALNGKIVILCQIGKPIAKIYNIVADVPKEIHMPRLHRSVIQSIAVSPAGDLLATAGETDLTARLWRIKEDEIRELYTLRGHTDSVYKVVFSGDGKSLATLGGDGLILWDLSKEKPEKKQFIEADNSTLGTRIRSVVFSVDGKKILIGSTSLYGDPSFPLVDFSISTYSIVENKVISTIKLKRRDSKFYGFYLSPDGKTAITTYENGEIVLRDAKTFDEVKSWKLPSRSNSIDFSHDAKYAVSGNKDGGIMIIQLSDGK